MYAGDVSGDTPATIGAALVVVGILVGKRYGAQAEAKFNRILIRVAVAAVVACAALVLMWWAIS
jgi:hypothetical protein